jgi:hypothetical protein
MTQLSVTTSRLDDLFAEVQTGMISFDQMVLADETGQVTAFEPLWAAIRQVGALTPRCGLLPHPNARAMQKYTSNVWKSRALAGAVAQRIQGA